MGEFKRSGGFGGKGKKGGFSKGGRGSFGGGDRSDFRRGGRDESRSEMFRATCAECRKSCEVPFRPSNDRPVYCSDCFESQRGGGDSGRRDSSRYDTPKRAPERNYHAPEVQSKPQGAQFGELKSQMVMMNQKLDQMIQLMSSAGKTEKEVQEPTLKTIVENAIVPKEEKSLKKASKKAEKKTVKKAVKKVAKKTPKKVAKKKSVKKKA